ncbi:PREDICTED: ribosome biogenesis protein BMS1 homolog, partial [Amphimedon queenslandica]|uniref:Bms1-type G domain-containing protein n=3 Tax=Amphimedon queenslandica TaxID=400682 RepID=A0AAN0IJ29_AMPQE
MMEATKQKSHKKRQAGTKAIKKKKRDKKGKENEEAEDQRNPKAFTYRSAIRAARSKRRTLDINEKRNRLPQVDRTPVEPPPVLIAVVGPPKVGKTTLINGLVKHFTHHTVSKNQGPVTLVSGKKRRITFIECNNDINTMIDIAKVVDLVLLLVDASFGFEMETFEFLNILQTHGFPRVMGVLTHLDMMKKNKNLRRLKKKLKQRFWTEIYQGAKLFYLSNIRHGQYMKNELHNLGRFISVTKFKPLDWQSSHPYLIADRMEDLTSPDSIKEDPLCNRTISVTYYDEMKEIMAERAKRNRQEFESLPPEQRQDYIGVQPGAYVRLEIPNIPCEFVQHFDPSYPIIVGSLLPGEEKLGYVRVRMKRHRWYKKILKSHDPLIVSMGWRRFQTLCVYSVEDHNGRRRMLKYTPEHIHCMASFYGPVTTPNTGVLAIQSVNNNINTSDFRVAATGLVLEMEKSTSIVKKLKLTGVPYKIFKNTAFIKGMFNTPLECAKFQGALIRTVSGIRGQVKKNLSSPE